jgi:hypothetical protein
LVQNQKNEKAGYLETDKGVNADFYKNFGFETVSGAKVLGT